MSTNAPRLVMVLNHARWFLTHRLPIAQAARDAGYEVHIATPRGDHVAEIERQGFAWHGFPLTVFRRNPIGDIVTLIALLRLYRRIRPSVVHHVTLKPVMYGTLAARLARVPSVVNAVVGLGDAFAEGRTSNRIRRSALRLLLRFTIRHPRMRIIFQNPDDRAALVRAGIVREEDTNLIKGAGVDPTVFFPASDRVAHEPMVVLVGRISRTKGVREFAEAARLLRARGTRARFVLAGEPDPIGTVNIPREELDSWIADGTLEFRGYVADVAALLREADVFVAPSYEIEGVPKALLEAAASALPIITTDTPGCREVVTHEDNGLLVPPRDAAALAAAIERLLQSPDLRRRFGARGRERALEEFPVDRVVAQTLDIYRRMVRS